MGSEGTIAALAGGGPWWSRRGLAAAGLRLRGGVMAAPPRGLRLSHALRFGVAAASAVALAAGLGLERGYWLGITIAVVLHPSLDPTLERTAHRLPGTLIGAAVGAVIIAYVSDTWALIAIASLLLGVAGAFIGFHYGLAVAATGGARGAASAPRGA